MSLFSTLRAIIYLKRISEAMSRIADDTSAMRRIHEDEWSAKHAPRPASRAPVEIGTMDQDEINRRYRQRIEEDMQV